MRIGAEAVRSAADEIGDPPQVRWAAADEHRGHRGLPPPAVELLADLGLRAHERDVLDQRKRHPLDGLLLATGEEEVLDLLDLLAVPHAGEDVGMEVDLPSPHAAD